MDVFGHHDVADHVESIAAPGLFERVLEDVPCVIRVKEGLPAIATEGDEVETVRLLKPDESPGHEVRVQAQSLPGL